ncbi:hypothetical protein [Sphingosinicella soli]|uniref:Uncharacterized protein n=1 Tax=Sphingosinicella soli TaxID=333708 RepID=A0A7W7B4Q4_9SPHN|nr:hypothetical protein [Sphingosinicella soli]MBB4632867.1 hypothetical protein [Sphingosinicella soli]
MSDEDTDFNLIYGETFAPNEPFDLEKATASLWHVLADSAGGEEQLLAMMEAAGLPTNQAPPPPALAMLPGTASTQGIFERDAAGRPLRHDGWTTARQIAFIDALRETACVETAARAAGKASSGAYKLRERSESFRAAWDAALKYSALDLERVAMERALCGTEEDVFDREGNKVGTRRRYNDRLLMFLLRATRPDKYGHTSATEYGRAVYVEQLEREREERKLSGGRNGRRGW